MKNRTEPWRLAAPAAAVALLAGAVSVPAQLRFDGSVDSAWTTVDNWTPPAIPALSSNVFIGSAVNPDAVVTIDGAATGTAKSVRFGESAGHRGTLNMTGGTLCGPGTPVIGNVLALGSAAGSIGVINQSGGTISGFYNANTDGHIGGADGSYGSWTMSGSAVVTGLHALGNYVIGGAGNGLPAGARGELILSDNALWSNAVNVFYVGNGPNNEGTLLVNGGTFYVKGGTRFGYGPGAVGRVIQTNGLLHLDTGTAPFGDTAGSVGHLEVLGGTCKIGPGPLTNAGDLYVGNAGQGTATVMRNAHLDVKRSVHIGYSVGSRGAMTIGDDATVTNGGTLYIAYGSNSVGSITMTGNARWTYTTPGQPLYIGKGGGANGSLAIAGGTFVSTRPVYVGSAYGGTGTLRVTAGIFSNSAATSISYDGVGGAGYGKLQLAGGEMRSGGIVNIGQQGGHVGEMEITGGTLYQPLSIMLGTIVNSTGILTVANTSQTNIAGAISVGSGSNGCGRVIVSNATLWCANDITVENGSGATRGCLELLGTQRWVRCSRFVVGDAGYVTNRVRRFAGGIDITNTVSTALTITTPGRIHLSFEDNPAIPGDFWGLRWAGTNGYARLVAYTNSGAITVANRLRGASATLPIEVYTDGTNTMIGFKATVVDELKGALLISR